MRARRQAPLRGGGFTLVEVLVALVIVAFGMSAVLAALGASAENIGALREKTLAQWVALNQIADVRLNLQAPLTGTTEGDVRGFGNADWHWQQTVTAVDQIPELLKIMVRVRRVAPAAAGKGGAGRAGAVAPGARDGLGREPDWTTTVIGFRGDALAAASGEVPDWTGTDFSAAAGGGAGPTVGGAQAPAGGAAQPNLPAVPGAPATPGALLPPAPVPGH